MTTLATPTSPRQQGLPVQTPAAGYLVTTARGHKLLVRRPDGRPTRVRPSGPLPATGRVQSGQSYLHVPAA
jgi:hypothetical protein